MLNPELLLLTFTIPAAPVAKGRARSAVKRGKGGKPILTANGQPIVTTYTPEATRNFEAVVKDFGAQAMGGRDLIACPIDILVELRFRIPDSWPKWKRALAAAGLLHHTAKPDCSNLVKAVEDALNGVVFVDDGQAVAVVPDKVWTAGSPCIVVHVFRRAGVAANVTRAEAEAALAGYNPDIRVDHLPIGRRLRTLRNVAP